MVGRRRVINAVSVATAEVLPRGYEIAPRLDASGGGGRVGRVNRRSARRRALGGVVGPAAFVTAWAVLGERLAGYSPVEDPISRLAAAGVPTRVPMTGGFMAFAIGVGAYAVEVRRGLSPATAAAAATTAVATLAVGALPLDASYGDEPHAIAAGAAYVALTLTPLAGAVSLRRRGNQAAAVGSAVTAVAVGALLAASTIDTAYRGLLQRSGLTLGDVWIAVTALWLACARRSRRLSDAARTGRSARPSSP